MSLIFRRANIEFTLKEQVLLLSILFFYWELLQIEVITTKIFSLLAFKKLKFMFHK